MKHALPALAGAIVRGTDVFAAGAVGLRKTGAGDHPVTLTDKFHVGSCTKAMTATLIARLIEEGRLRWTTTLAEVFPDLAADMHADWRSVTLEQLLTNRGGAPKELDADGLWQKLWKREGTPAQQRMTLLKAVTARPPECKPGTKFIYSNAGYAIAGCMAEKVTGETWENLMASRIFRPLGMGSAGFGAPGSAGEVSEPRGHRLDGGKTIAVEPGPEADNPPAIGPAGTVHCSVVDWARFVGAHVDGGKSRGALLKPETFAKLHEPVKPDSYAMGWDVQERSWGGTVLTHAGSNTMWLAVVWAAPEKGFAVVVMTNVAGPKVYEALDDAAGALIKRQLTAR